MNKTPTIHEYIAAERKAMHQRSEICIQEIKSIHRSKRIRVASKQERTWLTKRSTMFITQRPGQIRKYSPNKNPIGWYRVGQHSGLPAEDMALIVEVDAAFERWADAMRKCIPESHTKTLLGQRSGQARRHKGFRFQILQMVQQLQKEGVPAHHRVKAIARELDCNMEYVRRVLRESRRPAHPA